MSSKTEKSEIIQNETIVVDDDENDNNDSASNFFPANKSESSESSYELFKRPPTATGKRQNNNTQKSCLESLCRPENPVSKNLDVVDSLGLINQPQDQQQIRNHHQSHHHIPPKSNFNNIRKRSLTAEIKNKESSCYFENDKKSLSKHRKHESQKSYNRKQVVQPLELAKSRQGHSIHQDMERRNRNHDNKISCDNPKKNQVTEQSQGIGSSMRQHRKEKPSGFPYKCETESDNCTIRHDVADICTPRSSSSSGGSEWAENIVSGFKLAGIPKEIRQKEKDNNAGQYQSRLQEEQSNINSVLPKYHPPVAKKKMCPTSSKKKLPAGVKKQDSEKAHNQLESHEELKITAIKSQHGEISNNTNITVINLFDDEDPIVPKKYSTLQQENVTRSSTNEICVIKNSVAHDKEKFKNSIESDKNETTLSKSPDVINSNSLRQSESSKTTNGNETILLQQSAMFESIKLRKNDRSIESSNSVSSMQSAPSAYKDKLPESLKGSASYPVFNSPSESSFLRRNSIYSTVIVPFMKQGENSDYSDDVTLKDGTVRNVAKNTGDEKVNDSFDPDGYHALQLIANISSNNSECEVLNHMVRNGKHKQSDYRYKTTSSTPVTERNQMKDKNTDSSGNSAFGFIVSGVETIKSGIKNIPSLLSFSKQNNPDSELHTTPCNFQAKKRGVFGTNGGSTSTTLTDKLEMFGKPPMEKKRKTKPTPIQIGESVVREDVTYDSPSHENHSIPTRPETTFTSSISMDKSNGTRTIISSAPKVANKASNKPYTRSQQQGLLDKQNMDEAIEIYSSDSDCEKSKHKPKPLNNEVIDAIRISIGKKVHHLECSVAFHKPCTFEISYMLKRKSEQVINIHSIQFDKDVLEAKYYMESPIHDDGRPDKGEDDNAADCDRIECFLALRIEQKGHNNLRLNSWYSPKENDPLKRYIVIEFRNQNDLEQLIEMLKPMEITKAFFSLDSKLDQKHMGAYCKALLKDSEKEMERRNSFLSMNSTNLSKYKFLEGKKESDILLVYPFTGDKLQIEQCGIGLNEVGNWESIPFNKSILSSLTNNENVEKSNAIHQDIGQNDSNEKTNLRGHFVEINVNDFSRLEHGEFLNDSLIDFWFQWIWRSSDKKEYHTFSSHFYTTLVKEGPRGVKKWTEKKGINVFTKKFIFIPINKSLHWSLCVVVNPGAILTRIRIDEHICPTPDELANEPYPLLLFFDSLKAHQKELVSKKVCSWLNSEWRRLNLEKANFPESSTPFTKKYMPIYSPKIPYQNNSWDCGVFVCRYGYSMYLLRNVKFAVKEVGLQLDQSSSIQRIIDGEGAFSFDMSDISRIRDELKVLVENLSAVYSNWKKAKIRSESEEKRNSNSKLIGESSSLGIPIQITTKSMDTNSCVIDNVKDDSTVLDKNAQGTDPELAMVPVATETSIWSPSNNIGDRKERFLVCDRMEEKVDHNVGKSMQEQVRFTDSQDCDSVLQYVLQTSDSDEDKKKVHAPCTGSDLKHTRYQLNLSQSENDMQMLGTILSSGVDMKISTSLNREAIPKITTIGRSSCCESVVLDNKINKTMKENEQFAESYGERTDEDKLRGRRKIPMASKKSVHQIASSRTVPIRNTIKHPVQNSKENTQPEKSLTLSEFTVLKQLECHHSKQLPKHKHDKKILYTNFKNVKSTDSFEEIDMYDNCGQTVIDNAVDEVEKEINQIEKLISHELKVIKIEDTDII